MNPLLEEEQPDQYVVTVAFKSTSVYDKSLDYFK